jgi:hypothetical protein
MGVLSDWLMVYHTTIPCGVFEKSKRMRKEKTDRDPDL